MATPANAVQLRAEYAQLMTEVQMIGARADELTNLAIKQASGAAPSLHVSDCGRPPRPE